VVAVRKTRGGVMLVEERERFARLVAQGVSNAESCRIVGINRRRGYAGVTGAPSSTPLVRQCTICR
jgi:hypothetical protein